MVLIQNFKEATNQVFYLTSDESKAFSDQIREVKIIDRIIVGERDDFALISISPNCIIFDEIKCVNSEIKEFIIGARHKGFSVFGESFPIEVYICSTKENSGLYQKKFNSDELKIIAWATLHKSFPSSK